MPVQRIYLIRVAGHLDQHGSSWFDGLTITNEPNGEAVLSGVVLDQAALHGVLTRIRDLGLPLLEVTRRRDDDTWCAMSAFRPRQRTVVVQTHGGSSFGRRYQCAYR